MLTEEQRARRLEGLGASDSSIIMGYSSYKTPYQLYLEKIGTISSDEEETEQQYWGKMLEKVIIQRFEEDTGFKVTFPDTIYHPEYPFIFANLDGWIESEKAVVEAKCVNSFQKREWEHGPPLGYLIQIAKQCIVTNANYGYFAVLAGGMEFFMCRYERDAGLEALIIESDLEFWFKVHHKIEPDPINTSDCRLKFNSPHPDKVAQSTYRTSKALIDLQNLKLKLKNFEIEEDSIKMLLMSHMGNAEYLVGQEGEVLATWKANKKGTRVFNIK
jgi:putative phage-type endonuclease